MEQQQIAVWRTWKFFFLNCKMNSVTPSAYFLPLDTFVQKYGFYALNGTWIRFSLFLVKRAIHYIIRTHRASNTTNQRGEINSHGDPLGPYFFSFKCVSGLYKPMWVLQQQQQIVVSRPWKARNTLEWRKIQAPGILVGIHFTTSNTNSVQVCCFRKLLRLEWQWCPWYYSLVLYNPKPVLMGMALNLLSHFP